jgi:sensor histidine kinase YesM
MDKKVKLGREINEEENKKRDERLNAGLKIPLKSEFEALERKEENRFPEKKNKPINSEVEKRKESLSISGLFSSILFSGLTFFILFQYLPLLLARIFPYVPYSWLQIASVILSVLISLSLGILAFSIQENASKTLKLSARIPFALFFAGLFSLIVVPLNIFPPLIVFIYSIWFFCFTFLFGTSIFSGILFILRKISFVPKSILGGLASKIRDVKNKIVEKVLTKFRGKELEEKSTPETDEFMAEFYREVEKAKQELEKRDVH